MISPVSGILLAGGKSSRMGRDKGFIEFRGKTLAEFSLNLLRKHCVEILISSGNQNYKQFGVPIVTDDFPDKGPMGGVYSAMKHSSSDWCLVLACDLPYINSLLIEALLNVQAEGFSCIVPVHDGLLEPLAAVYHRSMIPELKKALEENRLSMFRVINSSTAYFLDTEHLLRDSPELFENLNSPENLIPFS